MKILKLPKQQLDLFASVLQQFGEVHAPVERKGKYVFEHLERWSDAALDYDRTVLPPKKYVLPPRETLLEYRRDTGYVPATEDLNKKIVLFGVHPCDIYGLNILDEVFAGKYPDPYYQTRRQNVAIIGIDCVPDEHCFCRSMRADFVEHGFDLFLCDIGEYYLTFVGTARGDDMVLSAGALFEDVTREDIDAYKRHSEAKREAFKLDVEIRDLPEIFEMEYRAEIWEELGQRCLSCGSCSMVCPTCYCYDVVDEVELGSTEGRRVRQWDSCLFSTHALVAGGDNFRESRASRIKFRFYHKQRGFVAEFGRPSCIGCGRCIVTCPVKIDIIEVINQLRGAEHVANA
ncbi:MAG: 4Fe-4S dicluster domain-containing protein [Gemmatimonadota bacterium]|nr:4Fe-4S dicluster domain-containing protein [Gemmatimonadota bacterium]